MTKAFSLVLCATLVLSLLLAPVARGQAPAIANLLNTVAPVYSFGGPDGANPYDGSGLVQDSAGNLYGTTFGGGSVGDGVVFKISTGGGLLALTSFTGANGKTPYAGLISVAGNFYGTTYYGGIGNDGTIFLINSAGALSRIFSFGGGNGRYPRGSLLAGAGDILYGTTEDGGGNGDGTVFTFDSTTLGYSLLHSFDDSDGEFPHVGLVTGTDGYLYGTTFNGGKNGDGTVFQVTSSNSFKSIFSFGGTDGNGPRYLISGSDGYLYGLTASGGKNGDGTVFRITTSGSLTSLCSLDGTNGQSPQSGLIQGPDGNFYGTAFSGGDNGGGVIFQVTPAGVLTPLYSLTATSGSNPYGELLLGSDGYFYGTAENGGANGDGTIFKFFRSGTATQLVSSTAYQILATNGPATFGATGLPAGLSVDPTSGIISGSAALSGTFNVTISATNLSGSGTAPLSIVVLPEPVPVISSTATATGTGDLPFTYQITATYNPTGFGATGLPPGLSVDPSLGIISGTPTATGSFSATISAINLGGTGSAPLSIILQAPPQPMVSSTLSATGTGDFPFSYQILGTENPTSFSAMGLPSGLVLDSTTGLITGNPLVAGSFSATIDAINLGGTGSATFSIVLAVPPGPTISSTLSATGTDAYAFDYQIAATNYPSQFTAMGLPPGVGYDSSTGLISGTPSQTGTFPASISAINLGGTDTETLTITILPTPPGVNSLPAATGTYNAPFTYQIAATNNPTSFGATGLPSGLNLNPSTGLISGTPAQTGIFASTITATNAGGTGSALLTVTINVNFSGVAGTYTGLGMTGGTNDALFSFSLSTRGLFTSTLTIAGARYPLSGRLTPYGTFNGTVGRGAAVVNAVLSVDGPVAGVSGTVSPISGSANNYSVQAALLGKFNAHTLPAGRGGEYTVLIPALGGTDPAIPHAPGYATMSVAPTGAIRIGGKLGDGTPFGAASQLEADGTTCTLFSLIYPGKHPGTLAGTLIFESLPDSDADAAVDWVKPPQLTGAYYQAGFAALDIDLFAAKHTAPALASGTSVITLTGGNLPDPGITDNLLVSSRDILKVSPPNQGSLNLLSISPATGVFGGRFLNPVTNKQTPFSGIIYQKPTPQGYGLFLGTDQSGPVSLIPQ
jgi:uncharacterized repeat protein (TIGR03803 family)